MGNELPPDQVQEFSARMAEEIAKHWACIDQSPRRAHHKAMIKTAIGSAIVNALMLTTEEEMGVRVVDGWRMRGGAGGL